MDNSKKTKSNTFCMKCGACVEFPSSTMSLKKFIQYIARLRLKIDNQDSIHWFDVEEPYKKLFYQPHYQCHVFLKTVESHILSHFHCHDRSSRILEFSCFDQLHLSSNKQLLLGHCWRNLQPTIGTYNQP